MSPLFYDVGSRVGIMTSIGFTTGFFFFKKWRTTRLLSMFGFGLGLGLNYSQVKVIWGITSGSQSKEVASAQLLEEIEDI